MKNKEHAIVNADETRHTHGPRARSELRRRGLVKRTRKQREEEEEEEQVGGAWKKEKKITVCQSSQGYRCKISHVHV